MVLSSQINAQVNLVMNPSFESYTACPSNTGGDVYKAVGWDTCKNTPDYFNTCSTYTEFACPNNLFGYQQPAHGNAYVGCLTYNSAFANEREIIIGQLTSSLVLGQKYYISFKASKIDWHGISGYSSNKLGVRFTKVKQTNVPINNVSHFYSNQLITDTMNWTTIVGSFFADSAYSYIMLGNFFDDSNTSVLMDGATSISYYYIDKVCVSSDSIFCSNYNEVGIEEVNSSFYNPIIFPNPADEQINVNIIDEFTVYTILGTKFLIINSKSSSKIDTSIWPSGCYFIKYQNKVFKLIIHH